MPLEALTQHKLKDIASQNVLPNYVDRLEEALTSHVALLRSFGALSQRQCGLQGV